MRFGLFGINVGACARPDSVVRVAQAAEAAGFDSVWTGEHVVLPDPQAPPSPAGPRDPFLDPAVALTWIAAHTKTLRLATGIIILPQRNPVVLAKEIASLDVLSGGRAILGIGAGYLEPEFRALGVPFARRGERTDESIDALRALWNDEKPAFSGDFVAFAGIDAHPRPVQRGGVPIVVGGASAGALRRAVARGNGWYGFAMDPATAERAIRGLEEARKQVERPAALGRLEITVTPPPGLDADGVRRYAELGVDRLALLGVHPDEARLLRVIESAAGTLFAAAR
ncbi:MAG TPA: LLM class F420-dependent oxidoreductase [Myxococcota bacterium]|nr:LLM class F420-dependent oxidoreductase [Myxococcota bacterium]